MPSKSFVSVLQTNYAVEAFAGKKPWLNRYLLTFRPTETTATLTLSDWADDKNPGGPIGQELMYNFIEVQPYFEE